MIRIIFLDVDGVLISHRCYREPLKIPGKPASADPDCVAALNRILRVTGAFIVVSSTWRHDGVMRMREHLNGWGVENRMIGITPTLREPAGIMVVQKARGLDIQAWLDEHKDARYHAESFVILDDDSDMEHLLPRLVHTKFDVGLTEEHADRAIKMLTLEECSE